MPAGMSKQFSRTDHTPAAPVETPDAEHETKFVLPGRARAQVLGRLRALCAADASHPVGIVSSIYYDSVGWRSVAEKRQSDYIKTKVRVRWYADAATGEPLGRAFIEAKIRTGTRRLKVRIDTEIPAARMSRLPLDDREVLELPRILAQAGFVLPGPILPVFEVSYARHRFVEPETKARYPLLFVNQNLVVSAGSTTAENAS